MRTNDAPFRIWSFALAPLLFLVAACGGGTSDIGGVGSDPGYHPQFPFQFEGVTPEPGSGKPLVVKLNFFTKNVATDNMSGEFDANSNLSMNDYSDPLAPSNGATFTGTFSQRNFTLMVKPDAGATFPFPAQYQGAFTDDNTVRLTPIGGGTSLTLRRNDNTFIPALTGNWAGTSASGQPWLIQLRTDLGFSADNDATVLFSGTEVLGGQFSKITGYASMRSIVMEVQRPGGTVEVTGDLTASTGKQTTSMKFGASSSIVRGGVPDTASALFVVGFPEMHLQNASLGGQPLSPVTSNVWPVQSGVSLAMSPDKQLLAISTIDTTGAQGVDLYSFASNTTTHVAGFLAQTIDSDIVWSPDSQSFAFIATIAANTGGNLYLVTSPVANPQWRKLSNNNSTTTYLYSPLWAPVGLALSYISYTNNHAELFVQASPATSTWSPVAISTGFNPSGTGGGVENYSWAPTGGQLIALTTNTGGTAQYDLYTVKPDATGYQKLNPLPELNGPIQFAWSPNAGSVAFGNRSTGAGANNFAIFVRPPNASDTPTPLANAAIGTSVEWNPAGTALLIQTQALGVPRPVWSIIQVNGGATVDLGEAGVCESHGHWSTDGTWVAYTHVVNPDSGYTCRYDAARADGTGQQPLSADGDATFDFKWVDGRRMVYVSNQDKLPYPNAAFDELFVGQAGGSGAIKLSSMPYDSEPIAYQWVLRKP